MSGLQIVLDPEQGRTEPKQGPVRETSGLLLVMDVCGSQPVGGDPDVVLHQMPLCSHRYLIWWFWFCGKSRSALCF